MKKGQGLSLQVVVIAILVMIVVLVLAAIFTGVIKNDFIPFQQGIIACKDPKSNCVEDREMCGEDFAVKLGCDTDKPGVRGEWCCQRDDG